MIRYAVAKDVAVYCHDVPAARSPLNFLGRVGDDMTVYPTYAARFLPSSMPRLPSAAQAANKYIERNEYSANYLKAHLGVGVRVLQNLVLLAGADHLDPGKCGQRRTLQAHLGVADRRAFLLIQDRSARPSRSSTHRRVSRPTWHDDAQARRAAG